MGNKIEEDSIYAVASFAEPKEIIEVLELCVKGDFENARKKLLETMLKQGLSGIDVIKQIQKESWNIKADNKIKLEMVKQCGEAEFRMIEGSDEFIQLEALLAKFVLLNTK
jgi:replication factor C small subunit